MPNFNSFCYHVIFCGFHLMKWYRQCHFISFLPNEMKWWVLNKLLKILKSRMKHPPKEVITEEHWTTLHLRTHPSQTRMFNHCFLFEPYLTIDQCWVSSSCGLWRDGLWKPLVQTNECMSPLPIRDMKEGYFRHCTWGKGCSASLPATSRWQDKKSRLLMTHKYRGSQQSSREVLPKFIDSTQGEPKNICKP
jgi:hypothetical protein